MPPAVSQIDPVERQVIELLRQERLRQKLSATQLAANVGVSRSTITHLEKDLARPTLWVLLKISQGLKLNLADVIRQAQEKPPRGKG